VFDGNSEFSNAFAVMKNRDVQFLMNIILKQMILWSLLFSKQLITL